MATVLKNILSFTGLAVGVPSVQAHLLNIDGVAKVPRVLSADGAGFTITADATNVTVTRGASADAAVNINCELWHSIEDCEPLPNGIATSMFPFVVQGGGSGGGAGGIRSIAGSGTASMTGPGVVFSNGGGITFGVIGNTLTASVQTAGGTATGVGFSAGSQSADTGVVRLANSNGLTWGMSDSSQVTASFSTAVFSNSNNVSFGLNGSTVTASASFPAQVAFGASAGTQSVSTGTLVFSNSNGITFGMSGSSRITASYSQSTSPNAIAVNAAGSITAGTVVFSNSNNITFGLNGSTVTASATFAAQTVQAAIAAVGGTITSGTASFANGNGVSFGINGQTITASVAAGAAAPAIRYLEYNAPQQTRVGGYYQGGLSMTVDRVVINNSMSITRNELFALGNTNGFTYGVALYTMGGSTASLASSRTASDALDLDRWRTVTGGTWNVTPGEYMLAVMGNLPGQDNIYMFLGQSRTFYSNTATTDAPHDYFAAGIVSSTARITAFPGSFVVSQVQQDFITNAMNILVMPTVRMIGTY